MIPKSIYEHVLDWLDTVKEIRPEKERDVFYLKKENIISLHDYLVRFCKYANEPESVTATQFDAPLDFTGLKCYEEKHENKWENIIKQGAIIFNTFLGAGHPFVDGNKRTGFVTLWIFLTINNYYVKFEFYEFNKHINNFKRWAISCSDDNISEISEWIRENETFYQTVKRCIENLKIKIKKLILR